MKMPLQEKTSANVQRRHTAAFMAGEHPAAAVFSDNRPQVQLHQSMANMAGNSMRMVAQRQLMHPAASSPQRDRAQLPPASGKSGLPAQLKAGIESLSGMSMEHVRVHYNSDRPAQLRAHAFAQGGDIHLAPGQERHLPHEAWHVVQQAQGRVTPNRQLPTESGPGSVAVTQRRLADPTGLAAATAEVKTGAKDALIETVMDLRRIYPDKTDWVDNTLALPGDRDAVSALVNNLSDVDLVGKINLIRTKYPKQGFDSAGFDVKPADPSPEHAYIQNLIAKTVEKMKDAAGREAELRGVFGDGDVTSAESIRAGNVAALKIAEGHAKLAAFGNIYVDTAGVAGRVGIGGYANYNRKIFLLVKDDVGAQPSPGAITTLFHESMHLRHSEIKDDGGYTSAGSAFRECSVDLKLKNADHYAEIARLIDGVSGHVLPFAPVVQGGVVGAKTNVNDNAETMDVRKNVQHRGRLLWSGAADLFLSALNNKRALSTSGSNNLSKLLNMTYHNTSWYKTPYLTEVDLSLAEATVNRIHRFVGETRTYMQDAGDDKYNFVKARYDAASGAGDTKVKNAGKAALVALGAASDTLTAKDKLPSVTERFDKMTRQG